MFLRCLSDRRASQRRRVLKTGKIFVNKGRSVVDCTVRSVSEGGAMVSVHAAAVPNEFDLLLNGIVHHCLVIWRRPDRIGVKFETPSHDHWTTPTAHDGNHHHSLNGLGLV